MPCPLPNWLEPWLILMEAGIALFANRSEAAICARCRSSCSAIKSSGSRRPRSTLTSSSCYLAWRFGPLILLWSASYIFWMFRCCLASLLCSASNLYWTRSAALMLEAIRPFNAFPSRSGTRSKNPSSLLNTASSRCCCYGFAYR